MEGKFLGVTKLNKTSHPWLWGGTFLVTVVSCTAGKLTLSLLTQKFCCLADCDVSKQDSSLLRFNNSKNTGTR